MKTPCMCSAFRMAARRLTQIYDAALAPAGLSTAQFALLNALGQTAAASTVNELADHMALDRTTLAHNLRPLEREGLVMVTMDQRDRRVRRIAMTGAGRARQASAEPLWRHAQARFEAEYGAERTTELRAAVLAVATLGRRAEPPSTTEPHHAG